MRDGFVVCDSGWAFARIDGFRGDAHVILGRRDGGWEWIADSASRPLGDSVKPCSHVPARIAAALLCAVAAPEREGSSVVTCDRSGGKTDLRAARWDDLCIPGDVCSVDGNVQFVNGRAQALSARYGEVFFGASSAALFGDIDGDGRDDAAVGIGCDNGGGTAAGQIGFGYAIFTSRLGSRRPVGVVHPRVQRPGYHVSLFDRIELKPSRIVVYERWYRNMDATCCPSGMATTVWTYAQGALTAGAPNVTG